MKPATREGSSPALQEKQLKQQLEQQQQQPHDSPNSAFEQQQQTLEETQSPSSPSPYCVTHFVPDTISDNNNNIDFSQNRPPALLAYNSSAIREQQQQRREKENVQCDGEETAKSDPRPVSRFTKKFSLYTASSDTSSSSDGKKKKRVIAYEGIGRYFSFRYLLKHGLHPYHVIWSIFAYHIFSVLTVPIMFVWYRCLMLQRASQSGSGGSLFNHDDTYASPFYGGRRQYDEPLLSSFEPAESSNTNTGAATGRSQNGTTVTATSHDEAGAVASAGGGGFSRTDKSMFLLSSIGWLLMIISLIVCLHVPVSISNFEYYDVQHHTAGAAFAVGSASSLRQPVLSLHHSAVSMSSVSSSQSSFVDDIYVVSCTTPASFAIKTNIDGYVAAARRYAVIQIHTANANNFSVVIINNATFNVDEYKRNFDVHGYERENGTAAAGIDTDPTLDYGRHSGWYIFQAVVLLSGNIIPVLVPVGLWMFVKLKPNKNIQDVRLCIFAIMIGRGTILSAIAVTLIKLVLGRYYPPVEISMSNVYQTNETEPAVMQQLALIDTLFTQLTDASLTWHPFGFFYGKFYTFYRGWPSGHTTTAVTMVYIILFTRVFSPFSATYRELWQLACDGVRRCCCRRSSSSSESETDSNDEHDSCRKSSSNDRVISSSYHHRIGREQSNSTSSTKKPLNNTKQITISNVKVAFDMVIFFLLAIGYLIFFIMLGVSVQAHFVSEIIAGTLFGIIIGHSVVAAHPPPPSMFDKELAALLDGYDSTSSSDGVGGGGNSSRALVGRRRALSQAGGARRYGCIDGDDRNTGMIDNRPGTIGGTATDRTYRPGTEEMNSFPSFARAFQSEQSQEKRRAAREAENASKRHGGDDDDDGKPVVQSNEYNFNQQYTTTNSQDDVSMTTPTMNGAAALKKDEGLTTAAVNEFYYNQKYTPENSKDTFVK